MERTHSLHNLNQQDVQTLSLLVSNDLVEAAQKEQKLSDKKERLDRALAMD